GGAARLEAFGPDRQRRARRSRRRHHRQRRPARRPAAGRVPGRGGGAHPGGDRSRPGCGAAMNWLLANWWIPPLVVAAGAIPLFLYLERRRREAYEEFCLMRGFTFERSRHSSPQPCAAVPLFAKGQSRRWGYTIGGRWNGRGFTAFEYRYSTGGGKNRHTETVSVMQWDGDDVALRGTRAFLVAPGAAPQGGRSRRAVGGRGRRPAVVPRAMR